MWWLVWYIKAVVEFLDTKSLISKIGQAEDGRPFPLLAGGFAGSRQEVP